MNKLRNMNTLRNQIFITYMLIMIAILSSVGFYLYGQVTKLLQSNTERHMENTAVQATGNIKLLLNQIDTFTTQILTNATVQTMLQHEFNGDKLHFEKRQQLQEEVRKFEAFMSGVRSIEIYTSDYRRLLPLTEDMLEERISQEWIKKVDEAKGQLVWLGMDARYPHVVVAARHIRLMNQSFSQAGYLVIHMDVNYFDLSEEQIIGIAETSREEFMWLTDELGNVLFTNSESDVMVPISMKDIDTIEIEHSQYYGVQRKIDTVDWQLSILTPVEKATEGISILRTGIIVSLVIGSILFLTVSYVLSGMIIKPILRLIKAMRSARMGTLRVIPAESSTIEINELNNTYNQMIESLNALIEVVYEKEILQSQTELKALQAQINPHFLFNTLEAFYWELESHGEDELAEVIVAMSGIFRYVINRNVEDEWVTLGDEIDHAERYLKIMKMRLMERLEWSIAVEDGLRSVAMPKLLIQPLIENAIHHGIERRVDTGIVSIRVQEVPEMRSIRIEVTDNGPGMSQEIIDKIKESIKNKQKNKQSENGLGVGMSNTEQRIKLYFGQTNDGLIIESIEGESTTISFLIPSVLERIKHENDTDH